MKMYKKIIAVAAAFVIMIVPVLVLAMPKKEFSENENRVLQKIPEVNVENVISGQLNEDIEDYMNDHFPWRDTLVSLKSSVQTGLGYKELNGVFVTEERLLQHIEEPNTSAFAKKINGLCENLSDTEVKVNLMVVPTNAQVYGEELPEHAPDVVDEKKAIDDIYAQVNCETIDVLGALMETKKDGNNLYYNLDHHWNFYGAYAGYVQFCNIVGNTPKSIQEFQPKTVTEDFRGSLYSKVLIDSMPSDEILAPELPDSGISVNFYDKKEIRDSYYDESFLNQKDKYCYFGSGNQALMEIENTNVESDKELVIVKDSFANCLIPFLIGDYRKIYVIDPRYYMPHISNFVQSHEKVTEVLVLYNIDSLNINSGIVKIK